MAIELWWYPAILAINAVIGGVLVYGVFGLMERRVGLGAFGGIVVGALVIYAEATLGERWFTITVGEMKLLVIAAAAGAVLGVVGTVLVFEPAR